MLNNIISLFTARTLCISVLCGVAFSQTTGLSPVAKQQFFTNGGLPCNGCLLYTYQAGTTTPQATFTDSTGGVSNANPVVADSAGRMNLWLTPGVGYKFVLTTASGATIWTVDSIVSLNGSLYLPLAGGTVTGAILSNINTNLGSAVFPFGSIFLSSALQMNGNVVIDSSRNVTAQNLSVLGNLSTSLIPNANATLSLGSGTNAYLNIYGGTYYEGANQMIDTNPAAYLKGIDICTDYPNCVGTFTTGAMIVRRGAATRIQVSDGGPGGGGTLLSWDSTGVTLENQINATGVTSVGFLPMTPGTTNLGASAALFNNTYSAVYNAGSGSTTQGIVAVYNALNGIPFSMSGTSPGAGITSGLVVGAVGSAGAMYPINGTTDLGLAGTQFRTLYVGSITAGGSAGFTGTKTAGTCVIQVVGGVVVSITIC